MKTTLRKIKKLRPCEEGWEKLISNVGADLDKEVTIKEILESNGIEDAVWALQAIDDQKSARLFSADVAESVLGIFEKECPNDKRPRIAIQAARDYANGLISEEQLKIARNDARDTRGITTYINANGSVRASARAAIYAANNTSYGTAYVVAIYATNAVAKTAAKTSDSKWQEIEKLLMKYL